MNKILLASAAIMAFAATHASASVSFTPFGTSLPTGETLFTDFDAGLPAGSIGTGALFNGSVSGVSAAPAIGPGVRDGSQYLTLTAGTAESFSFKSTREVSVYIGSLDSYNSVTLTGPDGFSQTLSGSELAAYIPTTAGGDQEGSGNNGRFVINSNHSITGLTLASSGNSLEVSNIATTPGVPEPASWAMMFVGLGLIGVMTRQRRLAAA